MVEHFNKKSKSEMLKLKIGKAVPQNMDKKRMSRNVYVSGRSDSNNLDANSPDGGKLLDGNGSGVRWTADSPDGGKPSNSPNRVSLAGDSDPSTC